jgi:quinolinate synthase
MLLQRMPTHETEYHGEALSCMRDRKPEITLDEDLRERALRPIVRMLEMS